MTSANATAHELMRRLQQAAEAHRWADAVRLAADLVATEGLDNATRLRRAMLLLDVGMYDAALVALDDVAARGIDERFALVGRANALVELDRLPDAEHALRAALRVAPSTARWTILGALLARLGRDDEASSCFSSALSMDPDNDEALYGLALAVGDQDPGRSIDLLRRATMLDPNGALLWRELAWYRVRMGQVLEAEEALRTAGGLNPADPWVHIYLAHCAVRRDDARRALAHLEVAATLAPETSAPLVIGAALAEMIGDLGSAARLAAASARYHPADSNAAYLVAHHLFRVGALTPALEWALRALELDARNARAARLVRQLSDRSRLY